MDSVPFSLAATSWQSRAAPELFQLPRTARTHSLTLVTTDFQLGDLSGFSYSLLGYLQMDSMVLVSFYDIKYGNEQQCNRVV